MDKITKELQPIQYDMFMLKHFLMLTSYFSAKLNNGETIDDIFSETAKKYHLGYISKRNVYYYTDYFSGHKIPEFIKHNLEEEIYAMAYAYAKLNQNSKEKPQTYIIRKKIREMKKKN